MFITVLLLLLLLIESGILLYVYHYVTSTTPNCSSFADLILKHGAFWCFYCQAQQFTNIYSIDPTIDTVHHHLHNGCAHWSSADSINIRKY